MRQLLPLTATLVATLLASSAVLIGSSVAQAPQSKCPQASASKYPFDGRYVYFDSVDQLSGTVHIVIHCVRIENAQHPYLVNWQDLQWRSASTGGDGYLESSLPLIRTTTIDTSDVYLGGNQTKFSPKIQKEISKAQNLIQKVGTLVSRYLGSIRKTPSGLENAGNFVSADLTFRASYQGGMGQLEFVNSATTNAAPLNFNFSAAIRQRIPELDKSFIIGPQPSFVQYRIVAAPVAESVGITFFNSDRQDVATIPLVMFAPATQ